MFEVFGPIARPVPSFLPLVLALLPLVGAAAFGERSRARRRALASLLVSAALAVAFLAWSLRWPGEERLLLAPMGVAARVGQLDLVLALGLDPFAALASAAVALVAFRLVFAQRNRRRIALLCAAASAAEMVVMADGAATLVLAFALLSIVAGTAGYVQSTHFVADRVADVAVIFATGVLFWALGGSWIDGQYAPELEPRVVAAADSPTERPPLLDDDDDERPAQPIAHGARSSLSFGGLPGSLVLVDGAWLRDARKQLVVSPFAGVPIAAGPHNVRVHVGPGSDDFVVPRMDATEGKPAALALRGSTTTFREIQDDLALRDAAGATPGRASLARRRFFGGASVASVVLGLLALAFAARVRAFPFAPSSAEPARALVGLAAIALLARCPVGEAAPRAVAGLAGALAVGALFSASSALRSGRVRALLAAELSLAGAGAIAGAPAIALVHAGAAAILFARDAGSIDRVAHLALLPTRAAIASGCAALAFGAAPAALVLLSSWLAACALARATTARASKWVTPVIALASLALAIDPRTFGGAGEPLATRLLAPSFRALSASPATTLPMLVLSAAIVGFAVVASRGDALRRLSRSPIVALADSWSPLPARATSALARAVAGALLELEARSSSLVRAADSLVRGAGTFASALDGAIARSTKRLEIPLPSARALRFVLVPVALAAAYVFAVPWAS